VDVSASVAELKGPGGEVPEEPDHTGAVADESEDLGAPSRETAACCKAKTMAAAQKLSDKKGERAQGDGGDTEENK